MQRLSDALLEEEKRDDAADVIAKCVEMEQKYFAEEGIASISMTAPDQSLVSADYATAEKLLAEKVHFFTSPAGRSTEVDVTRYQLSLASAQLAQGRIVEARATLDAARAYAEKHFGPQHPRVARLGRKLEAIPEVPTSA